MSELLSDIVFAHAGPLISAMTVTPCKNAAVSSAFQLAFKLTAGVEAHYLKRFTLTAQAY